MLLGVSSAVPVKFAGRGKLVGKCKRFQFLQNYAVEAARFFPAEQFGRKCSQELWCFPVVAVGATGDGSNRVLSGFLFEPFEEVKHELALVPTSPDKSLARQKYVDECEAAINEQINVEYNVSYVYHSMFAYFDRDNVALRGMAKFFKESSEEEREHAEKLMKYQNKRGGRVKLQSILLPLTEFNHEEKGDALYAMELALSLERLVNEKLLQVHSVAARCNDPHTTDFIESEFLGEQVEAIKKTSEYVVQLRRVGKGHGVWHFDKMLLS